MHAYDVAKHLAETVGPRWIGSDGEKRAGDWIEGEMTRLDLDVRRLWFDCPAWDYVDTQMTFDGEAVEAGALMFSPACDVEAATAIAHPNGEGDFAGNVDGKIAVFEEKDAGGVVSRGKLARALKAAGAHAAVVVSRLPETWSTKMVRDSEAGLAVVGVSAALGERLLDAPGARVHLVIDATPRPGKTSEVIGETGPVGAPVVLIAAHYDAAPYSPGALDNAAGVGIVLDLAERFAGTDLPCRMRFCTFGGHEFGGNTATPFGSKSYVEAYPEELADVALMFNLDGVGGKDAQPLLDVFGDDALLARFEHLTATMSDVTVQSASGGGGSDQKVFVQRGIDAVWLRSSESDDYHRTAYHSPLDDMRWVGDAELTRNAEVAHHLLSGFAASLV